VQFFHPAVPITTGRSVPLVTLRLSAYVQLRCSDPPIVPFSRPAFSSHDVLLSPPLNNRKNKGFLQGGPPGWMPPPLHLFRESLHLFREPLHLFSGRSIASVEYLPGDHIQRELNL
jgi:hypothetical protein